MAEILTENLITLEDILALKDRMRVLKKNWLDELTYRMANENPMINKSKVYNILHNMVVHQAHRTLFVKHAIDIITEEMKAQKTLIVKMRQAIEGVEDTTELEAENTEEQPPVQDEFLSRFEQKLLKIRQGK